MDKTYLQSDCRFKDVVSIKKQTHAITNKTMLKII